MGPSRSTSVWLVVAFGIALVVGDAQGQERMSIDRADAEGVPSASIPIRSPAETEVVQPERGVISQQRALTIPLEEPLDPNTYICGRGDQFELNFWGQQNFKLRVLVDVEGRTFISKIGYVRIAGRTLTQARELVRQAVKRYYPGLNFDMSLAVPRTFLLHIVGYFTHAGIYEATPIDRLTTVLKRAGEITGSRRRVEIRRRDGSKLTADLVKYELTGDVRYNPFVMDGDVITIPFADLTVSIGGAVHRPGEYELIDSKDLTELVGLAGGINSTLTRKLPIRVTGHGSKQQSVITDLAFKEGVAVPNMPLHDHDQVYVPTTAELQRTVMIIGAVAGATAANESTGSRRMQFSEGMTVRQLIQEAGGVAPAADLRHAYVRRGEDVVHVDLEALLVRRDFSKDVPLEIGDIVVIPQGRLGVAVEGAVTRPSVYPFNPELNAEKYIAIAGGPRSNATSFGSYQLISPNGNMRKLTRKTIVSPGDTLIVPERTFSRAEVVQLVMGGVGIAISCFTLVYLVTK